jgi:hypothetical protein
MADVTWEGLAMHSEAMEALAASIRADGELRTCTGCNVPDVFFMHPIAEKPLCWKCKLANERKCAACDIGLPRIPFLARLPGGPVLTCSVQCMARVLSEDLRKRQLPPEWAGVTSEAVAANIRASCMGIGEMKCEACRGALPQSPFRYTLPSGIQAIACSEACMWRLVGSGQPLSSAEWAAHRQDQQRALAAAASERMIAAIEQANGPAQIIADPGDSQPEPVCTCTINDLMAKGCTCGAIKREE